MSRRSARLSAQSSDMRPPRRLVKNRVVDSESETESGTSCSDDDEQRQQQQPTTPYKSPQRVLNKEDGMDLDSPFKENNNTPGNRGRDSGNAAPLQEVNVNKSNRLPLMMQELSVKMEPINAVEPLTQGEEKIIEESKPAAPSQRLVLKNLILTNFKSYAGRQVVGPFHSSFSAVVGPNGSGKSNVIDSLLFVFGFRASKMRQSKISALIHHSDAYPNLDFCSVEVIFQDVMDEGVAVEGTSLVVSRKAFKNNTSKYTINGKESSYSEVTELLRDRGIDLDHKRFLILQGEVESIAQMKPKAQNENDDGLLEYLEDIIGTAKYKKPIEEAIQEVETLTDVCMEKTDRLNIVEKERDSLEDKKNMVLKYLKQENELSIRQSELLQVKIFGASKTIQITSQLVQDLKQGLQEEKSKHKDDEEEMIRLEKDLNSNTKHLEKLTKELKENTKSLTKFESQRVQIEEQRRHLDSKFSKLAKMISTSEHTRNEAESWINNYSQELIELGDKSKELERQHEIEQGKLEEIRIELSEKTQDLSNKIENKEKQLQPWSEKINKKKSQMAIAESELEILKERGNSKNKAIQQVEERIVNTMKQGRAKERQIASLEKELERINSQIELGEGECKDAGGKLEIMRRHLSEMGNKTAEAKATILNNQTQGKVLSALMRLKETGRLVGFHGRLGNLASIEEKYDIAISTACPQLNNLVVDSVEVGQQCIEHLRKNNLGRGVLILIDRLAKRNLNKISTPENVPRLFDLIKVKEEKFAQAFYSVLQDTLVAQDLAQANRIAYGTSKRWRVVTLSGQLIDKSGTMSGGGTRVSKGGMKNKINDEISSSQVELMEKEKEIHEATFDGAKELYDNMIESLKELKEEKPKIELNISKMRLEIKALEGQLNDLQMEKSQVIVQGDNEGQGQEEEDNKVANAQDKVNKLQQEIQELQRATIGIEGEIEKIREKIMEAGGVRLRSQNSKVDGIYGQICGLQERISSIELSKAKALNELHKSCGIIDESGKEQDKLKIEMKEMEKEYGGKSSIVIQLQENDQEINNKIDTITESVEGIKREIENRLEEENKHRAVEIEAKNRIKENETIIEGGTKKVKICKEEIKKLVIHEIEGQEQELQELSPDEIEQIDMGQIEREIERITKGLQEYNQIDETILEEYKRRNIEYQEKRKELNKSVEECDKAKSRLEELRKRRLEEFMNGFRTISKKLKEMYRMITIGGNAELELVDSLDPFSEGILFSVMPPKKSWKNISNLSGGEKTLSSLSLVFALHQFKPTPIYIMDEIDAALDFKNVSIVANYIKEKTKNNGQFIIISLRNNMFELANRLIGIYKVNHMTRSVTLENNSLV